MYLSMSNTHHDQSEYTLCSRIIHAIRLRRERHSGKHHNNEFEGKHTGLKHLRKRHARPTIEQPRSAFSTTSRPIVDSHKTWRTIQAYRLQEDKASQKSFKKKLPWKRATYNQGCEKHGRTESCLSMTLTSSRQASTTTLNDAGCRFSTYQNPSSSQSPQDEIHGQQPGRDLMARSDDQQRVSHTAIHECSIEVCGIGPSRPVMQVNNLPTNPSVADISCSIESGEPDIPSPRKGYRASKKGKERAGTYPVKITLPEKAQDYLADVFASRSQVSLRVPDYELVGGYCDASR